MSYLSEYNLLIDSESLLIYSQSILMHEHIRTSISICVNNTRVRWRLHPLFNKMVKKKALLTVRDTNKKVKMVGNADVNSTLSSVNNSLVLKYVLFF